MSFRGNLARRGIRTDGQNISIPLGQLLVTGGLFSDFVALTSSLPTTITGLHVTYTAAELMSGMILHDPGADDAVVTSTAALILAALDNSAVAGTRFQCLIKNMASAEETITITGGTGVTVVSGEVTSTTITIRQNCAKMLHFIKTSATAMLCYAEGVIQTDPAFPMNYGPDTASDDTYLVAIPGVGAYTTGLMISFKAVTVNTGACTVNVNGLGAKSLKVSFDQDPANGWIKAGSMVLALYDGTNFQIVSPDATP